MDKVALQFSGGRDSLALLLYMQPEWNSLTVYHTSTGDDFPETIALCEKVRKVVPHFEYIQGDSPGVRGRYGPPSDLLIPGAAEWPFPEKHFKDYVPMQDRNWCCYRSLMEPMHQRMIDDGITVILRGQRSSDMAQGILKSGTIYDGVQLLYPIHSWTDDQVDDFILERGWRPPPFYAEGCKDTPNCMTCTAWLEYGGQQYVRRYYPSVYRGMQTVLKTLYPAVQQRFVRIQAIVEH